MKERILLLLMALMSLVSAADRPNILFIMSDDHASEAISAYGSFLKDYAKTPNIDRIAKDGMLFRNTFCNNSICSPSRASILTGQYSHINGVLNLNGHIKDTSPIFTEELQKAGYQTWLVGKWHLHSKPRGFDNYKVVKGQGTYFDPKFISPAGNEDVKGYSSDVYTDVALEWLGKRDKTKPFCMLLHFKAPHHDYAFPERHKNLLKDTKIPEPANLYEDVASSNSELKKAFLANSKFHLSREGKNNDYYERHTDEMEPHDPNNNKDKWRVAYQHMAKTYIRCVTAVDENVGRVLDFLDKENLKDNTIVVYTSDQGYWLGQHGFYDKRLVLEESLRMPLLVRYPKLVDAGSESKKLCSNVDFAPTLLDLCGVKIPDSMQGLSMKKILAGEKVNEWRDAVYYRYYSYPPHSGLRTEKYTMALINGKVDLFDLENDPMQMKNLAMDERYGPIIEKLKKQQLQIANEIGYSGEAVKALKKKSPSKPKKKKKDPRSN